MATILRTIEDPSKPVLKIIREDGGEVTVNVCNAGSAVWVAFALDAAKVRHKMRPLSAAESAAHWEAQSAMAAGAYI